jgi:TolB-like protein
MVLFTTGKTLFHALSKRSGHKVSKKYRVIRARTRSVIRKLGNIRSVKVLPTSTILKHAITPLDPVSAARELGVTHVVDGNIQLLGHRIQAADRVCAPTDPPRGVPVRLDVRCEL